MKYYWLSPTKGTNYIQGPPPTFKPVHWVYSKDQLDSILKFAENTMKMLYLFLSLLASQLSLGSPFMIRKEQNENEVETVSSEKSKTASLSTDTKEQPFLIMEGPKAPSKASSPGRYQAKCKRNNFNLLTSLKKYT